MTTVETATFFLINQMQNITLAQNAKLNNIH